MKKWFGALLLIGFMAVLSVGAFAASATANPLKDAQEKTAAPFFNSVTGAHFDVPANWSEIPLSARDEDGVICRALFQSDEDADCLIFYVCLDVWGNLPEIEKANYSRTGMDQKKPFWGRHYIAELFDIDENEIFLSGYGDETYYTAEIPADRFGNEISQSETVTGFFSEMSGYLHLLLFNGTPNSPRYSEFEELLSSAAFPPDVPDASTIDTLVHDLLWIAIAFLLQIAPLAFYRYKIKKTPVPAKQAKAIAIVDAMAVTVIWYGIMRVTGIYETAAATLVFAWLGYKILAGGYADEITPEEELQKTK